MRAKNSFLICKKEIFSIPMKPKKKVDERKRRPEFKSFFHKSFHKTDYSIIPQCHVRINKWIYNFTIGTRHSYLREHWGASERETVMVVPVRLHTFFFPRQLWADIAFVNSPNKESKMKTELTSLPFLLLKNARNLSLLQDAK